MPEPDAPSWSYVVPETSAVASASLLAPFADLFGWEWGAAGGEVESGRFGHDRGSWSVGGGHCDGCCLDRFSGRSDVFADDGCSGRRDLVLDRCQDRRRSPDRPDPRDVWLSAFTSSTR